MVTIACQVVIPAVSGRTRLPWTPDKIPNWEYATSCLFGGISPLALGVVGLWRNPKLAPPKGVIPDPQNRYEIAVTEDRVDELREYLRFTCAHFEQECLYFKVGSSVEFVPNPLGWPEGGGPT